VVRSEARNNKIIPFATCVSDRQTGNCEFMFGGIRRLYAAASVRGARLAAEADGHDAAAVSAASCTAWG
jgi:hypothetical protein